MLSAKYLLSGGAMIASMAIAAPVWAKTAMPVGAVAGVAQTATTVLYKQMSMQDCVVHRGGRHHMRHAYQRRSGDIANRLNRAELRRLSLSTMPPAGFAQAYTGAADMAGPYGGSYGQPNRTQGMRGGWQASASSRALNGYTQTSGSSRPPSEIGRYPLSPKGYAAQGYIDAPNMDGQPSRPQGMPGDGQASASSHANR